MDELLKKGKVQELNSAFGYNPVLARKKDGRWRMCVDSRLVHTVSAPLGGVVSLGT